MSNIKQILAGVAAQSGGSPYKTEVDKISFADAQAQGISLTDVSKNQYNQMVGQLKFTTDDGKTITCPVTVTGTTTLVVRECTEGYEKGDISIAPGRRKAYLI